MTLSNCSRCGKMLINSYSFFCAPCIDEQKEEIEKVKHYIKTNPRPSLMEAYQRTDVPIRTLQGLIRDGVISRLS